MKRLLGTGIIAALFFISSHTTAATMECYVDTIKFDTYRPNVCFALVWGANTATAAFRIEEDTSKVISSVIWSDDAHSCGTTSDRYCSFTIRAFRAYTAKATILYQDGSWDTASAIASFEDGS
ncbi:hypothetical protein ACJJIQ_06915 [Microbulbifer sp. ANSA003]|uniref:hypothetical protein n=1 Tax=unclassified Microbulbifer TaxID=2619833 RepID=UPI0040392DEA